MQPRRVAWPAGAKIALALSVALSGLALSERTVQAASGRWVLERVDADPPPSTASPSSSVTHTPGKIVRRTGGGWPVAEFTATYEPPPNELTPGRALEIEVAVSGRLESKDVSGQVGLDVIQLVNGTWNRVAVGAHAGCQPDPFPLGPLSCQSPVPASARFTYTPPATGTTFSVGIGVLNEQAGRYWRYRYEPGETTTSSARRTTTTTTTTTTTAPTATTRAPNRPKPPVILLPGVAGTELYEAGATGAAPTTQEEVWPFLGNSASRSSLAMDANGVPLGDIQVGEILMGTLTDFYGGMVEYLKDAHGYEVSRDLFTFPYDWRVSNDVHFAALDRLVNEARTKSGQTKVVLLAHSMGGLIARGYVLSSPTRAAKVDAVITMGTPYWGSPKVFYALVAGYTFGNPLVWASTMQSLVQNFPAGYQLLPHNPFVWDERANRWLSVDQAMDVDYGQQPNAGLLAAAREFHAIGGSRASPKPMPSGVELYTILGVGVRTLDEFALRAPRGRETGIGLGDDRVVLEPRFGDGDGTVPLDNLEISNATERYYLPWRKDDPTAHGGLANSTRVQEIVGEILSGSPPPSSEHPYPSVRAEDRNDPEPGVDFTLRSDAHLRVSAGTLDLGVDDRASLGTERGKAETRDLETLPGTFLRLNGVEYAALPVGAESAYDVQVTGIASGSFDLAVRRVTARDTTSVEYRSVTVVEGTVATVRISPEDLTGSPPLEVRDGGQTRFVAPVVLSTVSHDGGGEGVPFTVVGGAIGVAIAAVALGSLAILWWRRRRVPTG